MKNEDWLQHWREGRIGFHSHQPQPLLVAHWPALGVPTSGQVLVPLAGKSLDMVWLREQGHGVLGIELSPLAIEQFFAERALQPVIRESAHGRHYVAGPYELICADIFQLNPSVFSACVGVYDRAAMVALAPNMRRRYIDTVYRQLPRDCRGLMIVLEYDQRAMQGPPFSVSQQDLDAVFQPDWRVDLLASMDGLLQETHFAQIGVSSMLNVAYRLRHTSRSAG